jgi:uncharacterized protein YbjT (DUF2867 family)
MNAMKVLIFGASGMVGQGALLESLDAPDVSQVTLVGRARLERTHPKLQQLVCVDLMNVQSIEEALRGFDACFFCVGVSSAGMTEDAYRHLTHDMTISVASTLSRLDPGMTFVYVSGAGTDSTERGRTMWARVKGKTENDLRKLPFARVCLFRPSIIQPLNGIQSKTGSYRLFYSLAKPLLPLAHTLFPRHVLTTAELGGAMLNAVRQGAGGVFEVADIASLARGSRPSAA